MRHAEADSDDNQLAINMKRLPIIVLLAALALVLSSIPALPEAAACGRCDADADSTGIDLGAGELPSTQGPTTVVPGNTTTNSGPPNNTTSNSPNTNTTGSGELPPGDPNGVQDNGNAAFGQPGVVDNPDGFCALVPGYGVCPDGPAVCPGGEPATNGCPLPPVVVTPQIVIPPPTEGEAAQNARANMNWPTINPHPKGYSGKVLPGGFESSLVTWGYESWDDVVATADIDVTVNTGAGSATQTFSATLTATPVQVVWDTGQNNANVTQHTPPTEITCTGPGNTTFHQQTRRFQDWREHQAENYAGYGGTDCLFTYWGLNTSGSTTTISATITWELELYRDWGPVADRTSTIADYSQTYTSTGWSIDLPTAVNVSDGPEADNGQLLGLND